MNQNLLSIRRITYVCNVFCNLIPPDRSTTFKLTILSFFFSPLFFLTLSAQDTVLIGTGTASNGTSAYPCPFQDYYEGSRAQYLYLASELSTAGASCGNITQVAFNVTSVPTGTFPQIEQFTLKIGTTSNSSLASGAWESSPITVYGPFDLTPTLGMNYITLSTPFTWDGTSNLVVEVCNGDPNNGTYTSWTNNYGVTWTTGLAFNGSRTYRADNIGNLCGATTATENGTPSTRPNIGFIINSSANDVAVTGLSTNFSCAAGADSVTVSFTNAGTATQTSIPVYLSINGGSFSLVTTYTGSLTSCNSASISFPVTVGTGFNDIEVAVDVTGDLDASNDTMSTSALKSLALSGTYTLGGATANFGSFAELILAAQTCGISGATTVNVNAAAGPFNEQVIFQGISGLSSTNTLTINGNGATIEFDGGSTGSDYRIVGFDAVEHIIFDNFNIVELGTSTAFGVHFGNGASNITVQNCTIDFSNVTVNSSTVVGVVSSGSLTSSTTAPTASSNNLTITNNLIKGTAAGGAYYGMTIYGAAASFGTNNTISNNTVENQYSWGIGAYYQQNLNIIGNDVSAKDRTATTTKYGVYLINGLKNANVSGNYIHHLMSGIPSSTSTSYGIYISSCDGDSANPNLFANNIIGNFESNGAQYGFYNTNSDYQYIYHNTISLDYTGGSGSSTYGIYQTTLASGVDIKNNIISVTRTGGTSLRANLYFATTTSSITSNYNVLHNDVNNTATNNNIGYYGSTGYAELSNWITANGGIYDTNSVQSEPVFSNPSLDNFTPVSGAIDNLGTPIASVTNDFYGVARPSSPDMGAIEFTGVNNDVALLGASIIRESICYGTNDTLEFTIKNVIGGTINFATDSLVINWDIQGPINSSGAHVVSTGTLASGSQAAFSAAVANLSAPGNYTLNVHLVSSSINASTANDTLQGAASSEVQSLLSVAPSMVVITSPFDSVELVAQSPLLPAGQVLFSEITQFHATTGQPAGGWGAFSWVSDDDGLELIGAPNASLEGFTVRTYNSGSATHSYEFTFGAGAQLNASGVAYLGWGGTAGAVDATNNYYSAGISGTGLGSTSVVGYTLSSPNGTLSDVVANGTSYSWNAATGVTAAHWGANMTASSGSTSGIRRIAAVDNNTGSDWVVSSASNPQDPGTYNTTVNAIAAPAATGFTWSLGASVIGNTPAIFVGPFTMDDTLYYVATFDSTCGVYADTAMVIIDLVKAEITSSSAVLCNGDSTGTATVSVSGGDAPYSYLWNTGDTLASVATLFAGTHTVTVTDANGWTSVDSVTISEPTALGLSISTTNASCGLDNGTASATASGGTSPYSYSWSNGDTVSVSTGLASGTYSVTISDANGCTIDSSGVVMNAGAPTATLTPSNITCGGTSTGSISSSVTGGTAPYAYQWSNGATTSNISGVAAGTYTLTVTDNVSCATIVSATITQNPVLVINAATIVNVSCNGGANGSITRTYSGGVAPYSYLWSNGATTASVSGLSAGSYSVTLTDANSCTATATATVTQPTVLLSSISAQSNVSCNGGSNGSITASASGGTAPYTYAWSNGGTTATISGLTFGTYNVTVTDSKGCTSTSGGTITQPTVLSTTVGTITNVLCNGASTGSIPTTTTGGTMPYTYSWTGGGTTATKSAAAAGTYTITVTDANGCSTTASGTISEPTAIVATDSIITPLCNGDTNGAIYLSSSGGTGTLSWSWSSGQSTEDIDPIVAGTYTVTITDANNCSVFYNYSVVEPAVLSFNIDQINNSNCEYGSNGQIQVTTTGGTVPYAYVWSNGSTNEDATGLSVGTYTLTVTDTNGCSFSDSASVGFNIAAPAVAITGDDTICFGEVGFLTATSGYPNYSWSTGSILPLIVPDSSGIYSVTVTTAQGCQNWASIEVLIGDSISLDLNAVDVACEGTATGSVGASVSGTTGTVVYVWSTGSTAASISNLAAGTYSLTITDGLGCSAESEVSIDFTFTNPSISLGSDTVICYYPELMTFASVNLTPGSGFAAYTWSTGESSESITIDLPGEYTVEVEDVNGCFGTDTVMVDSTICVGIEEYARAMQISIYPNPVRDVANVVVENTTALEVALELYSLNGTLIEQERGATTDGMYRTEIDMREKPQGIYFIKITSGSSTQTLRVVVQ